MSLPDHDVCSSEEGSPSWSRPTLEDRICFHKACSSVGPTTRSLGDQSHSSAPGKIPPRPSDKKRALLPWKTTQRGYGKAETNPLLNDEKSGISRHNYDRLLQSETETSRHVYDRLLQSETETSRRVYDRLPQSETGLARNRHHDTATECSERSGCPNRPEETRTLLPNDEGISFKRKIDLASAVTLMMGSIIGSGIFVSPKGVLQNSGSVGAALLVWTLCGVHTFIGAMVYTELGATFPVSGADYSYIRLMFGDLPAFLCIWMQVLVGQSCGKAISALTFANYLLEPFFAPCPLPPNCVRLVAGLALCLLTYINCRNVQWATRVQDVFTFAKIIALIIIIIAGAYHLLMGNTQNFDNAFQGTTKEPGYIALSFYSGLFSYAGWNFLNFVTEELKDPFKNLPRAIYISLPLVTVIYVLANVAYFAVLTPDEILASNAVAVTFGERILGVMAWIMPFSVALSTFGGLNGNIFASARLFFVGAREGHLPNFLSMINLNYLTPAPSLVFLCLLSLAYLSTTEVYVLINYTAFVEALFVTLSVSGLVWLRYTQPELERPIKVNIILPVTFLIVCAFLVIFPFYVSPWETGMGIAITITGIPVYYVTIYWKNKPRFYKRAIRKVTAVVQKVLLSVPEEKRD